MLISGCQLDINPDNHSAPVQHRVCDDLSPPNIDRNRFVVDNVSKMNNESVFSPDMGALLCAARTRDAGKTKSANIS